MHKQAERDMAGEGFAAKDMTARAEVQVRAGGRSRTVLLPAKRGRVENRIAQAISRGAGKPVIETVRLVTECAVPRWEPVKETKAAGSAPRRKGRRKVRWTRDNAEVTPIYARAALKYGHTVRGPAIVEGPDTGYAVAAGWTLTVGPWGDFVMTRDARALACRRGSGGGRAHDTAPGGDARSRTGDHDLRPRSPARCWPISAPTS